MLEEFAIFDNSLEELPNKKMLINTINAYSYVMTKKDALFKEALINCEILIPDGVSVVLAVKLLFGRKITKIAGADLFFYEMNKLNKTGGKCFFLGSSQDTLDKIVAKAKMEFPKIQVEVFSPPYKPTFSEEENAEMISRVNAYNPDVLFVGMTAPKQEKWAYTHYDKLNINAHIGSIGAVFDFYAGTVDRPSPFWINLGLEWFIRLIKEPKRMWKRYLYYGPIFIKMIVEQKLKQLFKI
ncbi:WecB/TagA/CpsF family glycosyltransferase [Flavobacterium degerlachei]|jgi:N-acetylglucosaminyldiphosphoundecaprenol N-acetyl-beta-D-mannosaminyltransferase|uniref:N-acetylglucosaminyldiphosphoundecaprenol N-acetyl-beta-D-mannosaminyltransferase n=1 Tax=Flavobacterium degerlachei TaxID=229203 RepID=A0A1H2VN42_9FLAO|nr:WecB/TagA/CpsF family glycosyltransferase [Flavobacterium degerlachei]SDW69763.1 N-acetylglucosaminyldiphosphoundecaprenol N-acetyl-beta-D-mannosaminyltransferase [Flavobacterium degerlachei]